MLNNKNILVTDKRKAFGEKFTEIVLKTFGTKKLTMFSLGELKKSKWSKTSLQTKILPFNISSVTPETRNDWIAHAEASIYSG